MINTGITIGQYIPGDSVVHKADPRTKIILSIVFMVVIFLVNSFWTIMAMTLFVLLSVIISGVPMKYTLRGLKPILFIIIFTAVINMFTTSGTPISQTVPFRYITWEGIILAVRLAVRLALIIISGSLLTFTTTPILLTDGIEKLLSPFRRIGVPAHELAMMMSIALRFIPTLLEETGKIMKAQAARERILTLAISYSGQRAMCRYWCRYSSARSEGRTNWQRRWRQDATGAERKDQAAQPEFTSADAKIVLVTFVFFTGLLLLEYL